MPNAVAPSVGATSGSEPSLTASAIVAQAVSGSHILRIDGYSRTKGLGNGQFIASETFSVGGHRWCLRYYPDSDCLKDSDWISVFLHLDNTTVDEVEAIFKISLLDQDGNPVINLLDEVGYPVPSFSKLSTPCSFSSCQGAKGFNLIKRSDLEGSVYLKDDVFSVRCDVTVSEEIFTKAIPVSDVRPGVVKQER